MSEHTGSRDQNNQVVEFSTQKTVRQQAAEWVARLDGDEPSEATLKEFRQWVNAKEAHRSAFSELTEFWDDMNSLTQIVLPREINGELLGRWIRKKGVLRKNVLEGKYGPLVWDTLRPSVFLWLLFFCMLFSLLMHLRSTQRQ